ncbi:MAG: hypothetical protein N3F07_00180 [Candidatus Micrarchaeota archaeon]|nr:hypothetical protein [Candidatus Micrarchaeota archaeon]
MRTVALICVMLSLSFAAEFSLEPYLFASEKNASINYTDFSYNNSTAKIVRINGEEALLLIDGKLATSTQDIAAAISYYYQQNFYPSKQDMEALLGFAEAFNKSRNAKTKFGPAEKVCYEQGTLLSHKPCSDMKSCTMTATLICTLSGADGCIVDVLAGHILSYSKSIEKLNTAYAKFQSAHSGFSAGTVADSLNSMESALDEMKSAADEVKKSKLIFPETYSCADCIGICPEPKFDYSAISSGKAKIAELRSKTAPFSSLNKVSAKIALSTQERIAYREGEEKAKIYEPKYSAAKGKYASLKEKVLAARALVADSGFVSAADSFLSKEEELEKRVAKRQFDGFEPLLSAYTDEAAKLSGMINNSTSAYHSALEAQDSAGDLLLQALWKTNPLDGKMAEKYNGLAEKKNKIDEKLKPPMTSEKYAEIEAEYGAFSSEVRAYLASSSSSPLLPIFELGNSFGRSSIDSTVSLASSMAPISFKTRQSMAAYVLPVALGVIDLSILALALLAFAGIFHHFHGMFKSKLAISGWVLAFVAFAFILLAGSIGFYGIVLSSEKYASFSDFFNSLKHSDKAAVVVHQTGVGSETAKAMDKCASQIESQLAILGKKTIKYYIDGSRCRYLLPMNSTNSTNLTYKEVADQTAEKCLDSLPDVPVFDLKYSEANQPPIFTTVVAKQAIIKGNQNYYSKKPMCDIANILN